MPLLSWDEAANECESSGGWTLLSLSSAKILKGAVSLLKRDVQFWVANMSKIPDVGMYDHSITKITADFQ
jgi:hypothetical protein